MLSGFFRVGIVRFLVVRYGMCGMAGGWGFVVCAGDENVIADAGHRKKQRQCEQDHEPDAFFIGIVVMIVGMCGMAHKNPRKQSWRGDGGLRSEKDIRLSTAL
jgi:hypothetical protein